MRWLSGADESCPDFGFELGGGGLAAETVLESFEGGERGGPSVASLGRAAGLVENAGAASEPLLLAGRLAGGDFDAGERFIPTLEARLDFNGGGLKSNQWPEGVDAAIESCEGSFALAGRLPRTRGGDDEINLR